jgi:IclR helix-turn-helix domain
LCINNSVVISVPISLLLTLRSDVDSAVVKLLERYEDVKVIVNAPETAAIIEGEAYPISIEAVGPTELREGLATGRPRGRRLLVVNAVLDDAAAARLEDSGVGYLDATGRRWLPGWDRTKRSNEARAQARGALRGAGLRLAQLLADFPEEPWTERGLSRRAGTTQPTAHRLLRRLEDEGLLERRGKGRGTRRHVVDAGLLRSWLAREGRPGRVQTLTCFVRDSRGLPPSIEGHRLAYTGAAGAEIWGMSVLTESPQPLVRVDAAPNELEGIPEALGGFRTKDGPNLTLIADPQRLAFTDSPHGHPPQPVAPPSRTLLDLYLEPRGEAAVDVFLSLWGSLGTLKAPSEE